MLFSESFQVRLGFCKGGKLKWTSDEIWKRAVLLAKQNMVIVNRGIPDIYNREIDNSLLYTSLKHLPANCCYEAISVNGTKTSELKCRIFIGPKGSWIDVSIALKCALWEMLATWFTLLLIYRWYIGLYSNTARINRSCCHVWSISVPRRVWSWNGEQSWLFSTQNTILD